MWKAALALFAVALIAGCQKPAEAPSPGASSTSGASGGGEAKTGKLKIAYIPKNTGNPYFTDVIKGFQDEVKESGDDFVTNAPANAQDPQTPIIQEQVQQKVDVIVVSASSPDALNAALDDAKSKGILVLTVDADLTGNEQHRDAAVLQAAPETIGQSQLELLGKEIGYQGDFAILSATKDAPNQNAWIAAMQDALKQPKYAKMKLVEVAYGDDEPQKSTTEFEALLTKHPGLRGVISPTSVGLAAAARSLQISGVFPGGPNAKGPGLVLTGLSTPNQMKGFVKAGVVQAFQLWSPHDMGYAAASLADQVKAGKVKIAEGTKFTAGKLGELTIGKDNVIFACPLITFDTSNIDQYDF
ncbi:MAG TPA: substrate-binding domain-containing protein [Fimbriimonadaceae bacterium]|nr:substrate-binding domain-containing protein [Fimbriimonadaceae bacterium]